MNRVYSKNATEEQAVGRDLFKRISVQINHYRAQIESWSEEYDALLALPTAERSALQIERLILLDDALEQAVAADQALALTFKRELLNRDGLFGKQDELFAQAEHLIAAMKNTLEK